MLRNFLILAFMTALSILPVAAQLPGPNVELQVLGSGGPEINDGRSSTGYLIWVDGKARVLVDLGSGTAHNFEQVGGRLEDLEAILLSHLHVDHCADLPSLVKSLFFADRTAALPILGPEGATWFPSTKEFVERLFAERDSAFPYLSDFLDPREASALQPRSIRGNWSQDVSQELRVECRSVTHGSVPALAWRVDIGDVSIVFSGDFNGRSGELEVLAKDCDILVCHNAVPESARGLARRLHAPPSVIGQIAKASGANRLILSHRMLRTTGVEGETLQYIRESYQGKVDFADDLSIYNL